MSTPQGLGPDAVPDTTGLRLNKQNDYKLSGCLDEVSNAFARQKLNESWLALAYKAAELEAQNFEM